MHRVDRQDAPETHPGASYAAAFAPAARSHVHLESGRAPPCATAMYVQPRSSVGDVARAFVMGGVMGGTSVALHTLFSGASMRGLGRHMAGPALMMGTVFAVGTVVRG